MRSELEILEKIDLYLEGKLSAADSSAFESEISTNPELNSLVENQKLLIQTVNRQAMMAELNSIAAAGGAVGGASAWGLSQWLLSIIGVIGLSIGGYYIYNSFENTSAFEASEIAEDIQAEITPSNSDTGDIISFELAEASDEYENELSLYVNPPKEKKPTKIKQGNKDGVLLGNDMLELKDPITSDDIKPLKSEKVDNQTKSTKNRKAVFPGGLLAMKKFFKKELSYPRTPKDKGLQGTVKVNFLVSADGKISHMEANCFILKDRDGKPLNSGKMFANLKSQKYFEEAASRVFRISSPWTPATNSDGNPMLSSQEWYVNFDINGESSSYQLEDEEVKVPTCKVSSEEDWELVTLEPMNIKSQPKKFNLLGESMLKTNREIQDIDDLTSAQYKEICQMAAKYKSCIVFIDINHFWEETPGQLYYYFGTYNN